MCGIGAEGPPASVGGRGSNTEDLPVGRDAGAGRF